MKNRKKERYTRTSSTMLEDNKLRRVSADLPSVLGTFERENSTVVIFFISSSSFL